MADDQDMPPESDIDPQLEAEVARAHQAMENVVMDIDVDPMNRIMSVETITAYHAWFSLHVVAPYVASLETPIIHGPDSLVDAPEQAEFVYPIIDQGDIYSTSKAADFLNAGYSMCRLSYTIEKIIWLLNEKLKDDDSETGGLMDPSREIQLAIHGHPWALRYAFSSVINLPGNVIIVNFDPGTWGEAYLNTINHWAEKGYGYPMESPRDIFKKSPGSPTLKK